VQHCSLLLEIASRVVLEVGMLLLLLLDDAGSSSGSRVWWRKSIGWLLYHMSPS